MEKMDKNLIRKLAKDLMFELSEAEIESIHADSNNFMSQVNVLQAIDTEGVEVMSYPIETETSWLREDNVDHVLEQEAAFENAPRVQGDYFEIVKVVNK